MKKQIIGLFCLILLAAGCSSKDQIEWPEGKLAQMVPALSGEGYAHCGDDSLSANKYKASYSDWQSYVEECKKLGYTVEPEEEDQSYLAYNSEGYELEVTYKSGIEHLDVDLKAPVQLETIQWPNHGLAALLPKPNTDQGRIQRDTSTDFIAYVAMDQSEMWTYQDICFDAGFDQNYDSSAKRFTAKNKDGDSLLIQKDGFHTVRISLDSHTQLEEMQKLLDSADSNSEEEDDSGEKTAKADGSKNEPETKKEDTAQKSSQKEQDSQKETKPVEEPAQSAEDKPVRVDQAPIDSGSAAGNSDSSKPSSSSNSSSSSKPERTGVSASYKEAVDGYEAFMYEYADFMERYQDSDNVLAMVKDYGTMMKNYAEWARKIEALEDQDRTWEEVEYLLNAQQRINEYLIEHLPEEAQ